MSTEHTSKQFDAELEALRARVLQMGGLVEEQIKLAVDALVTGDHDRCVAIEANDHRVNGMEVAIDEDCSTIIARRQPAAGDLRMIMTVVKTITDLERIGDEAEKIGARVVRHLSIAGWKDQHVDEEFRGVIRQLITFMMEDPRTISASIEILFIAKAIERIGDHAKNISEYVIYMVKGKDVRHVSVEEIEREIGN